MSDYWRVMRPGKNQVEAEAALHNRMIRKYGYLNYSFHLSAADFASDLIPQLKMQNGA